MLGYTMDSDGISLQHIVECAESMSNDHLINEDAAHFAVDELDAAFIGLVPVKQWKRPTSLT